LARFLGFPDGFELLEGNVHNQNAPPNDELVMLGPQGMPIIQNFHWILGHHGAH
jgi:hypothetical protein